MHLRGFNGSTIILRPIPVQCSDEALNLTIVAVRGTEFVFQVTLGLQHKIRQMLQLAHLKGCRVFIGVVLDI